MGQLECRHEERWTIAVAVVQPGGRRRALVWDTLSHPRDMAGWLPLISPLELVIVYSHADWDHIWGTAGPPS